MDGKLVLKHRESGKIIEVDFDTNQNLTKNNEQPIKNKKKSEDIMDKEETKTEETESETDKTKKDTTEDIKGVVDGQTINTPAEGDDYEAGDKVRGDPYNETEHYVKKGDMEDMIKRITQDLMDKIVQGKLEPLQKDLESYRKDKEIKEEAEEKDLIEVLQKEPYGLKMDSIEDLTLVQLREKKATYDELPMIKDFYQENRHLTHEQVSTYAFDMTPSNDNFDFKSTIFKAAQHDFVNDLGEDRYKKDFGGAN